MLLVAVIAVAVAVAKPWQPAEPNRTPAPGPLGALGARGSGLAGPSLEPSPSPAFRAPADAAALGLCFGIGEWRVVTVQTWAGPTVRTWIAAGAVQATQPLDPAIPFTPVVARTVPSLGICAPVTGPDRPSPDAEYAIWRLDHGRLARLAPATREPATRTPLARLWWPPGVVTGPAGDPKVDEASVTWPPGRYVVRLASPAGRYVRWLGIDVRLEGGGITG